MSSQNKNKELVFVFRYLIIALFAVLLSYSQVSAFTLIVQEPNGSPVNGNRYLVEHDIGYDHVPGVPVGDSLGVGIHISHAPVLLSGHTDSNTATINLPGDRRYMVSVLPDAGHTMSGAAVAVGQSEVVVTVNPHPVPTAMVTIFVFHDNQSINGAMDLPAEPGLEGFTVTIYDQLGQMMFDAFGNNLGTTYMQNPDSSFMLDADGVPIVDMMGSGVILSDANGEAVIKYIHPGKYGIRIIPPNGTDWIQTSTLEGTPGNDV